MCFEKEQTWIRKINLVKFNKTNLEVYREVLFS